MKVKIIFILLFIILLTSPVFAQWPGCFYAFELKDIDGKTIDSLNTDYKFSIDMSNPYLLSIKMCDDNKTWRFYKGDKNLYIVNTLTIMKISTGVAMLLEFPPSLSGGKKKYYLNLYTGRIIFKNGTYSVKLPESYDDLDYLKEIKICPLTYMNTEYFYISGFQNRNCIKPKH